MTQLKQQIVKQVFDTYQRYIDSLDQHHRAKEAVLDRKQKNKALEMGYVLQGIPGKNQGERDAWLADKMADPIGAQSALETIERMSAHAVTIAKLEVDRMHWQVRSLELFEQADQDEQEWEQVAAELIDRNGEVIQ